MTWEQKLAALRAEAAELAKKGLDLSDDEVTRAGEITTEIAEAEGHIQRAKNAGDLLRRAGATGQVVSTSTGDEEQTAGSIGEAFVRSAALVAWRESNPVAPAQGTPIQVSAKGLGKRVSRADPAPLTTGTHGDTAPTRLAGIDDVTYRPGNTLLDLITIGTTNSPWLQYRQLIQVTSGASRVPESAATSGTGVASGEKPLSTLETRTADAKAHTFADGIEITTQELTDDGALVALINGILTKNLRNELERILLEGDDNSDEPTGILNLSGVLEQTFVTDAVTSIRKAKTLLANTSQTIPNAVLLNPVDDEAFDLLQDGNERYYGNGPFGSGPSTIWSIPRFVSHAVPVGTAIAGDFSQVQLLIYEALSILAFNQHKDYARRNLVYLRAELRALQLIRQPAKLALIRLTGAPVVQSVTVTPATASIKVGASVALDADTVPVGAAHVSWSTSDATKATVSQQGVVTGVAVGSATITATAGGQTDTTAVTVAAA